MDRLPPEMFYHHHTDLEFSYYVAQSQLYNSTDVCTISKIFLAATLLLSLHVPLSVPCLMLWDIISIKTYIQGRKKKTYCVF